MFDIPPETLELWEREARSRATPDEIDAITAAVGLPIPYDYLSFIVTYGYVEFDFHVRSGFRYHYEGEKEGRSGAISHIKSAEHLIRTYRNLTGTTVLEGQSFPLAMLPVGMDYGQGEIIVECGTGKGAVWYWNGDDWISGDPLRFAYVAASFTGFMNSLAMFEA